jgi:proteasome lid subunit RPN8/RPN11
VKISRQVLDDIRAHAVAGYPYEICGALIARPVERTVIHSRRMANIEIVHPEVRYRLDDREHIAVQRAADDLGLEIVGFYHSHPDHPAVASETDEKDSWANLYYLIVSSANGTTGDANVFTAESDHGKMRREPLEVV